MAVIFKIKGKDVSIKFNYRMMFKANKKLGTKNEDGESQNDGAGVLFVQIMERDDDAVINLLELVDPKATENECLDAIASYIEDLDIEDEAEAYEQMFKDVEEEMLDSGFFMSKVQKYIENLEKAVEVLEAKKDSEAKEQAKAVKELAERMKKEISSYSARGKD